MLLKIQKGSNRCLHVVLLLLLLLSCSQLFASPTLININFGAYANEVKVGYAATGQSTNDYWNRYEAPFATAAAVTNLLYADGTPSAAGLTVLNGPGHYNNGLPDIMYATYDYAVGNNISVSVTNLIAGSYDIYVYGHAAADNANGIYSLSVGADSYGTNATVVGPGWDSVAWQEGVQYVVFRGVVISNSAQALDLTVYPSASSYSIISGMQIAPAGDLVPQAPTIISQPQNRSVASGSNATFTVSAIGTGPLSYQWQFNGVDITGATSSSLALTGVTTNQAGNYAVIITNSVGSVTSSNATLTIATRPVIITQPQSQTVPAGGSASFSVVASGDMPLHYQWLFNGGSLSGATNSSLLLTNVTASRAGQYRVTVSNAAGSITSSNATLQVAAPPVITSQPQNKSVASGGNVTFAVGAVGTGPLSFQWQFNGADIPGATSSILTLSGVTTNQAGNYAVTITNSVGSVTSSNAVLTIIVPPVILTQPQSQTVLAGGTASFSVVASGSAPLHYQWLFNGGSLPGATQSSLLLTNVTASRAGQYRVTVSNTSGSTVSSNATLQIAAPPAITSQPQDQSVPEGGAAIFSVTTSGSNPLSYQWKLNGVGIAGATGSNLVLSDVSTNDAGAYSVVVSNSFGSVVSSNASLTVMPVNTSAGLINLNFGAYAQNVKVGYAAIGQSTNDYWNRYVAPFANAAAVPNLQYADGSFSLAGLTVLNGPGHYDFNLPDMMYATYDYNQGGNITVSVTNLATGTYDIYVYGHGPADNANGIYSLSVGSDNYGTNATVFGPGWNSVVWQEGVQYVVFRGVAISNSAQGLNLTVYPSASSYSIIAGMQIAPVGSTVAQAPIIISQPQNQTVGMGGSATFGVAVGGTGPFSYQWQFNGVDVTGATNASLILSGVDTNQAGDYSVTITNSVGSVTSSNATLTISLPPVIVTQPQSQTVLAGGSASFSVVASGDMPLSYQWAFNGNPLAGATGSSLSISNVIVSSAGQYSVSISTAGGVIVSSNATLQVVAPPVITSQPQNQTVLEGGTATFIVAASGSSPLSYQWQFNGVDIAGATASSLILSGVETNQAGNYSVTITNSIGSVTSSNASLTVLVPTVVSNALINLNFGAYAQNVKVGYAAIGQSTNDYWNRYAAPYANAAAVPNLLYADGSASAAGLTVLNGPGHYDFNLPDMMYCTYDYNQGGNITVSVTNLATGTYDIYVYGHGPADNANGIYSLSVGTDSYGTNATVFGPGWNSAAWQEGIQYVVFRGVAISDPAQGLNLTVYPSASSYSIIAGMQIAPVGSAVAQAPSIISQPQNQTMGAGGSATFGVRVSGTGPLSYQWHFNGVDIAGATASSLILSGVETNQAGNYSVTITNSVGSVTSSNASLTVLAPTVSSGALININFGAYAQNVKVGYAAIGQSTNDYWNRYAAPYANAAAVPNLLYADGSASAAGLTVLNGPGHYDFNLPDMMYATYDYNQGGNITVSVTNLAAGTYDIYVYGHGPADNANGIYSLSVGTDSYGTNATVFGPGWNSVAWQEGIQYVVFRGVVISNSAQGLNLTVYPSASSYSIISGLQIAATSAAAPQPPQVVAQPQSQSVTEGANAILSVTASGSGPLYYQWQFNGIDISGATGASLVLNNVATNQAGNYSVSITNAYGSVTSSNATLNVAPPGEGLININFAAYPSDVKVGFAATGQSTNDYWNPYLAPFANAAAVPNLLLSDGTVSAVGLTVLNGYGHFNNGVADPMYSSYDYNQGYTISITLTNLGVGTYDLYIYGHGPADNANGIYSLSVGTNSYGTNSTVLGPGWNSTNWQEGIQYVVFRAVTISDQTQVLSLTVYPSPSSYSIISGLQVVPRDITPPTGLSENHIKTTYVNKTRQLSFVSNVGLEMTHQGGNIILSWPSVGTNYVVQEADGLLSNSWTDISTNSIVRDATKNSLSLPSPTGPRFYRLRHP